MRQPSTMVSAQERMRTHRALMDGIGALEDRIAPLWAADRPPVSSLHRAVRARVTSNGFRELDVLLAHWVGLLNGRPVRMDDADGWREGGAHEYPFDAVFTPSDIMRIAADYRLAALPSAMADRDLAA